MTIYALSTGPGISGVAIIRVSGPHSSKVIKSLTGQPLPKARVATLRKINNIETSELIDEGIIFTHGRNNFSLTEDTNNFKHDIITLN